MGRATWQPLAGVKVLSFELAFALPAGTRALHDLGADVVRVSPPARQVDRYVGVIDGVFHGKSSISIDLTATAGRELGQQLAAQADVVCSNFRPHVLTKYGLGARQLRGRHARLITLQLSGYGTPGPWANYPAFGPSTEAAGGLNRLMVNAGETPLRLGSAVFADQLAGRYAALAVINALREREQSGVGQALDLSMAAGITHMLGQKMTQAYRHGEVPRNSGNRDRRYAPQGVYRCRGTQPDASAPDEWVAISVATDAQWRALHELLVENGVSGGIPEADANHEQRWEAHDAIDRALERVSQSATKDALAQRLQARGVPAMAVRTVADQALDPNVQARGTLGLVKHARPVLGHRAHPHPGLPWRVVARRLRAVRDYRHTGVDNAAVLNRWLGMSAAQVRALEQAGVLWREPALNLKPRRPARHRDADHGQRLGLPR